MRNFDLEMKISWLDANTTPFISSEWKDKVETGNKVLVQTFHLQLTQEIEVLHKIVEDSTN